MAENGDVEPGGEPGGDDALVLALATGATINDAAERGGCSPRTVSRRLAERAFVQRISTLRSRLFDAATGRLANSAATAADKLVELLECDQPHIAFAAAKSILELGTKLREAGELEQRIAALEGGGLTESEGTDVDSTTAMDGSHGDAPTSNQIDETGNDAA